MSASLIRGLHVPALLFHFLALQQPCEALRDLCWRGGKGREKPMTQTSKELAIKSKNSAHTFAHIHQGSNGDFTLESMESL